MKDTNEGYYNVQKAIDNIFNKVGVLIPYNVVIKDWDSNDQLGGFCQFDKVININKHIINDDKLLTRVIYHEYLHLFLQVDNKFFYDVLIDRYTMTYFTYLNKFCDKYQIWSAYPNSDICCHFKQSNSVGLKNVNRLSKYKSLSNNYNQFSMLSEFIVHNSDYFYGCDFNEEFFDNRLLEMNKFVLNLVKTNIK